MYDLDFTLIPFFFIPSIFFCSSPFIWQLFPCIEWHQFYWNRRTAQQVSWKNCVASKMYRFFCVCLKYIFLFCLLVCKSEIVKTKHLHIIHWWICTACKLLRIWVEIEFSFFFVFIGAWFIWIQRQTCVTFKVLRWLIYSRIFSNESVGSKTKWRYLWCISFEKKN